MSTPANPSQDALSLTIVTSRGSATFTFAKTTKVEEVIREVREHFELTGEGTFSLIRKSTNEELSPHERTLVSFGIESGEELILTGAGVNV